MRPSGEHFSRWERSGTSRQDGGHHRDVKPSEKKGKERSLDRTGKKRASSTSTSRATSSLKSKRENSRDGPRKPERPEKKQDVAECSVKTERVVTLSTSGFSVSVLPPTENETAGAGPKTKKGNRSRPCIFEGCKEDNRYCRLHALNYHVPHIFDPTRDPRIEARSRIAALRMLASLLTGNTSLEHLANYLDCGRILTRCQDCKVQENQKIAIDLVCQELHQPIPDNYTLVPLSTPAAMIHWKVVLEIVHALPEEDRRRLFSCFPTSRQIRQQQSSETPMEVDKSTREGEENQPNPSSEEQSTRVEGGERQIRFTCSRVTLSPFYFI